MLLSDRRLRVTHTQFRGLGESSEPTLHVSARKSGAALLDINGKGQGLKSAGTCISFCLMSDLMSSVLIRKTMSWKGRVQCGHFIIVLSLMAQSGNRARCLPYQNLNSSQELFILQWNQNLFSLKNYAILTYLERPIGS